MFRYSRRCECFNRKISLFRLEIKKNYKLLSFLKIKEILLRVMDLKLSYFGEKIVCQNVRGGIFWYV